MAKQSTKATNPTPEEVVAQNGGLEGIVTPAVENDANDVEVVAPEDVVAETPAPVTPEVQAPLTETTPVVEEAQERTMECLGLKNHTCRIGGNVITVIKDKVQTFPAGVATVLQRASVVIVK